MGGSVILGKDSNTLLLEAPSRVRSPGPVRVPRRALGRIVIVAA